MKKTRWVASLALSLMIAGAWSGSASAAKKDKSGMTPEMQAQMTKAMEMEKPGPQHAILMALAGNWNCTVQSWMKPGGTPMISTGTATFTPILDGRFLKQEFHGNFMGKPFEGLGFVGYDTFRGEYNSIWMDSIATGMMKGAGQYDAATKTLSDSGDFSCPMTNDKHQTYRSEWKFTDNDHSTYSMYTKDPATGKEYKGMDITYTRAK